MGRTGSHIGPVFGFLYQHEATSVLFVASETANVESEYCFVRAKDCSKKFLPTRGRWVQTPTVGLANHRRFHSSRNSWNHSLYRGRPLFHSLPDFRALVTSIFFADREVSVLGQIRSYDEFVLWTNAVFVKWPPPAIYISTVSSPFSLTDRRDRARTRDWALFCTPLARFSRPWTGDGAQLHLSDA